MLLVNGADAHEDSHTKNSFLKAENLSTEESDNGPGRQENAHPTDISSVITQVTTREAAPYRPPPPSIHHTTGLQPQQSWKDRFRSLLCCFAPETGYFKTTGEQVAVRSVAPPVPKFLHREALIGPQREEDFNKKTLVLDLDETLVHSSFKPIPNPDYIIPVEIDGKMVDVYVLKRPWLDHFMESVGHRFEVVVFTASLAKYADPLLDLLDKSNVVRWRLFRESCFPYEGNYVKDLSCLGRDLANTIIVDNSPHSYVFQPSNALPIGTFIDNMEDQELLEMLPLLAQIECVEDVRLHLDPALRH
mmetsp:Transcript_12282/g.26498  ORF Transcript_12282/g.26498 Transcript_12282/m.26498 type:complete len:304 (+) Transcript_12282:243-1154(+)|eukprot:CAMPEP_0202920976 /NCGR_PEP_ID=MMETSP1392-20130828/77141_1 /ASSEMBLY_ACC=CAM_ASM_000868 /TAXON_ID=225041 /ORGANISM="Chlamydomonas chlamydogama, Strain SAG 11-48b" /LENGTH=303 /DNA_ID=CAMNT_0049614503 /DNA_START=243 /DNA_END=1154 /DNA_ORIENTATION=+